MRLWRARRTHRRAAGVDVDRRRALQHFYAADVVERQSLGDVDGRSPK